MPDDILSVYDIDGYVSYFNSRQAKRGGDTMILVNRRLVSRQLGSAITPKTVSSMRVWLLLVEVANRFAVYRVPWASSADTKELYKARATTCTAQLADIFCKLRTRG